MRPCPPSARSSLAAPAPLGGLALIAGDAALVAGLGAYAFGLNGAATLTASALALRLYGGLYAKNVTTCPTQLPGVHHT